MRETVSSLGGAEAFAAILNEEPKEAFLIETAAGLTPAELATLVRLLRASAKAPEGLARVAAQPHWTVMDLCGTGGSRGSRLNTSTLTALFVPEFGVAVAKHGGRSASGKKGSLDLLEALGLDPARCYARAADSLRALGLCYLGAAFTYAPFARYAPLRKAFGRPTLFNLLGPLLNPAPLRTRLLGCYDTRVQDLLAETVERLGESALLVCSHDDEGPLDEGAPWSDTRLVSVTPKAEGSSAPSDVREAVLPATMPRPAKRSDLFSDGVAAARAFLAGENSAEARSAALMVGYNTALAVFAAHVTSGPTRDALLVGGVPARFDERAGAEVATLFEGFRVTLAAHLARARARLEAVGALEETHARSPVSVPSRAAEGGRVNVDASSGTRVTVASQRRNFPWSPVRGLLIAEVKNKTPTRSFEGGLDLETRLRAYAKADALSVVTHPSFAGDTALLSRVRSLSDKPLLAKDFVRTPAEVEGLVAAGADGVLILLDMVGEETARLLAARAEELGAAAFVESTFTIPSFGIPMLNSRNLHSLAEGRAHRDALAARLAAGRPSVIASSIRSPWEAVALRALSGAVVVGGALMETGDEASVEEWIREASRPGFLKACGARDASDARTAIDAGAALVGVNLIPRSKRRITRAALEDLLTRTELLRRLVFLTDVTSDAAELALVREVLASWAGRPGAAANAFVPPLEQCYFAPRLGDACGRIALAETHEDGHAGPPRLSGLRLALLDGGTPGSGKAEPYPAARPGAARMPVLCAGGVTVQNAGSRWAEALAAGHPVAGLDVASGVETRTPDGRRAGFDPEAISALVALLSHGVPCGHGGHGGSGEHGEHEAQGPTTSFPQGKAP